jgi:uncharacterized protein
MLLSRDINHGQFEIRSYAPGAIKINDITYDHSVILTQNSLIVWSPATLQEVTAQELEPILKLEPTIVLLGTGVQATFVGDPLLRSLYENQIGVEVMTTDAACRTFNVLMSEGRNVVAALLIR